MAMEQPAGGDRVSALLDATLIRILSHLHTDEAVRTSALSRRWRHVFTTVPVVNLARPWSPDLDENLVTVGHMVNSALLIRDCTAPIRSFRVIGFRNPPSGTLIDQWITTALFAGVEKVDLDVSPRYPERPIWPHTVNSSRTSDASMLMELSCTMPRHLFSSTAATTLRHLRLGNCRLALPEQDLSLGSLETLSLRRINAPGEALQRLIAGCPGLAELTLEECPTVKRISVALLHLRSFTIRCCHNATRVFIDAPSLRFLGFKGSVPACSVLSLADWGGVALALDICEKVDSEDSEKIRRLDLFLEGCTNLTSLRLSAQQKPPFFLWYRASLPGLTHLELTGPFRNRGHIAAVAKILDNTANLEVLTLVIDRPQVYEVSTCRVIKVPKDVLRSSAAECFRRTLRKIHLVRYSGNATQRRLAKFLLGNAVRTEELHVTFASSVGGAGPETADRLKQEMEGWKRNPRTRIIFAHG